MTREAGLDAAAQRRSRDADGQSEVKPRRMSASVACAGLQSRQLHADAGSAGGGQAVVADEPEGEASTTGRDTFRIQPWSFRGGT